ncbi:hypothetical protein B5F77_08645 [Parabacteroides sp. An277]|nr:hypothetical protein B5F77_08645 [Parabacteroides sp. An277]
MSMSPEDIEAIVFYRRQKAYATLQEAEEMIQTAHWNLAIQRLYYAAFYMASALLVKNKISTQTHNGVVAQLGLHFVTTGKLDKAEGRLYSRLLQNRITGDYNDFFDFTEEDAKALLDPTKELMKKLDALLAES